MKTQSYQRSYMKQLFSVLLAVFALSLTVSAQENIELNINGVKIETTEAQVIQKLGKPSSRKKGANNSECRGGNAVILRYPGLLIELETSDGTAVIAVATVTLPKWSFSGIKIGASVSEVQKKLGSSELERKKDLGYLYYGVGDGGAKLVFQKGRLVKIHWEFNFC